MKMGYVPKSIYLYAFRQYAEMPDIREDLRHHGKWYFELTINSAHFAPAHQFLLDHVRNKL